jgi:hypothetical protein
LFEKESLERVGYCVVKEFFKNGLEKNKLRKV